MPPYLTHRNRKLVLDQSRLLTASLEETYLSSDIAATSGTLTVANINGYAINQVLLINPWGEKAEFVKTHASTVPTGSTITLAANTVYAHSMGEKVYVVQFNQAELAWSLTATGTKTALTTTTGFGLISLEADNQKLVYNEREKESGYYFSRFVSNIGATFTVSGSTLTSTAHGLLNGDIVKLTAATTIPTGFSTTIAYYVVSAATNTFSISLTNGGTAVSASDSGTGTLTWYRTSEYSDPVPYGGWERNTVGFMIERGLSDVKVKLGELITLSDCYEWLNSGMKLVQGKLKRWAEHWSYNAVLGQVQRGTNVLAMPNDAYDLETNRSLVRFRIGTRGDLSYLDPDSFDAALGSVAVTKVTTQANAAATSLAINNSYDYADSGSVHVYISGTASTLTYTAVTRSATAGALTGIPASGTGSISVTIPADTYVWQNEQEGVPSVFTVRNAQIEWYPLADASSDNANAFGDYTKVATVVDSDSDVIDYQRYDMLQDYLTWRMKMKFKNNGNLDEEDGWFKSFRTRMNDAIRTMPSNNLFRMSPKLNTMGRGTDRTNLNMRNVPYAGQ